MTFPNRLVTKLTGHTGKPHLPPSSRTINPHQQPSPLGPVHCATYSSLSGQYVLPPSPFPPPPTKSPLPQPFAFPPPLPLLNPQLDPNRLLRPLHPPLQPSQILPHHAKIRAHTNLLGARLRSARYSRQ